MTQGLAAALPVPYSATVSASQGVEHSDRLMRATLLGMAANSARAAAKNCQLMTVTDHHSMLITKSDDVCARQRLHRET
jgi:hypothetical protein